jgi:DUF971 family protein
MSCDVLDLPEWPSEVLLNKSGRTLDLVWGGNAATLAHMDLRASCRCSQCESMRRATGAAPAVAPDLELSRIEVLGSTGLQLFFSDGHSRGIYPWAYLYQLAFEPTQLQSKACDEQSFQR